MSDFWLDPSSTSILHVCEQRRLWRAFSGRLCILILVVRQKTSLTWNRRSTFLAHLSRRLIWWAYRIGRPLSSVVRRPSYVVVRRPSYVVVRHRPHSLNIFSSETTGPIKVKKIHMELLWDGGTKVCPNSPGHMTKMAAMPIYGKNLKKSSSLEPKDWWPWKLVCIIGYIQVCSNDDPGLTLTYFTARSNLVPYVFCFFFFYGKKVFQKLLSSMIWN